MTFEEVKSLIRYGLQLYPNALWKQSDDEIELMASAWMSWVGEFEKKEVLDAFKFACAESATRFPTAPLVFSYIKAFKKENSKNTTEISNDHEKIVHCWLSSDEGKNEANIIRNCILLLF